MRSRPPSPSARRLVLTQHARGAVRSSAGDGAASGAFRRSAPGDGDCCGPRRRPLAPWEPGRRRDEAQQGGGGAVHRLGAGFRPVAPRGEWGLKRRLASAQARPRPSAAPASWLPAAAAPWHLGCGAVGLARSGGRRGVGEPEGDGRRGEPAAGGRWCQRFLFLWPPSDCPHPRAHPGPGSLGAGGPRGLVPGLGRLPYPAGFFSSPGQLPAAAEAAPSRLGGWWNPAGTDTAPGWAFAAVTGPS